jgi:hypothetical protein
VSAEETTEARATREALVGDLAHQVSVLVRKDLELAAVQRAPEIRQLAIEIGAALAAAAALFLTLGALSWAAFQGLAVAFEPWTAALIVAAAWTAISLLAISIDHPRRLLRRLGKGAHEEALSDAGAERELALQEVRTTANELRQELRREAHERERQLLSDAGHRVAHAAERDLEVLLKEILGVLGAPGESGSTCSSGSSREPTRSRRTQGRPDRLFGPGLTFPAWLSTKTPSEGDRVTKPQQEPLRLGRHSSSVGGHD